MAGRGSAGVFKRWSQPIGGTQRRQPGRVTFDGDAPGALGKFGQQGNASDARQRVRKARMSIRQP
jgi:hypothetical protein